MRPLIIDDSVRAAIKNVVEYSIANPFSMDNLLDVMNNPDLAAGNNPSHVAMLPFGYRVVFSIENQSFGTVYHLSMSVDTDDKLPNPYTIMAIMNEIGFTNALEDCHIDIENLAPSRLAISVSEMHDIHKDF